MAGGCRDLVVGPRNGINVAGNASSDTGDRLFAKPKPECAKSGHIGHKALEP
jgi:hypothetical protein